MATKIIFEDGENVCSSYMLRKSLYGNNIYFSNGAYNLFDKAYDIAEKGDNILIFYDVSPNNKSTYDGYNEALRSAKTIKEFKAYIVPIICIEYYLCKLERQYGLIKSGNIVETLLKYIVDDFDWGALPENIKQHEYIGISLEKAYKYIISNSAKKCLRNVDTSSNIYGKFYKEDCGHWCEKYCDKNISLKDKANKLYTMLPMFIADDKQIGDVLEVCANYRKTSYDDTIERMQKLYDSVCDSMGIERLRLK